MNLNPHHHRIYLRVWLLYVIFDVKYVKPQFFYISLASGGKILYVKNVKLPFFYIFWLLWAFAPRSAL